MFGKKPNNSNPAPAASTDETQFGGSNFYRQGQQLTSVRLKEGSGKVFLFFALLTLIFTLAASGYLYLKKQDLDEQLKEVTANKDKLLQEFNGPQNSKIVTDSTQIASRVKTLSTILDARVRWSDLLEVINQDSLKAVKYTNIAVDENNNLTMLLEAKNYEVFARAVKAWEASDAVTDVNLGKVELTESEANPDQQIVAFEINAVLKKADAGNQEEAATTQTPAAATNPVKP